MTFMIQRLSQALISRQKQHLVERRRVRSAVLLPIYYREGQYYLLFIKRTEKVKNHKGQISFPGGVYSEEDRTLLNTALRESAEEIGLAPSDTEILGALDDTATITSGYVISPFVAIIPWPYQFKMNREEVEEIIEVPISVLLNKGCVPQKTKIIDGETVTSYFYHYQGNVIWGATARILNQLLDILAQVLKGE